MLYRVNTTNQPEGSPLVTVEDHEFVDLQRMGLLVPGKGDLDEDGNLRPKIAKTAPPEVTTATPNTGAVSTQTGA